jgi:hypothetical protein
MRSCANEHPEPWKTAETCRLCHLYMTDPAWRKDGDNPPTPAELAACGGRYPGVGDTPPNPPIPAHEGPSLLRKAFNFAVAATKHIAAGAPIATTDEQRFRLSICEACLPPEGYYDAARKVCTHSSCGCSLEAKVRWKDQSCPIRRW